MFDELLHQTRGYFFSHVLSIVGFAMALVLLSRILKEQRSTGATFAWILAIALIPYVGVPLYLMFGGRKLQRMAGSKAPLYRQPAAPSGQRPIERVLCSLGAPPAAKGNAVTLLSSGEEAYRAFIDLIAAADQRVDLATFILGDDDAGNGVCAALAKSAARGVEVHLLLDAMFARRSPQKGLAAVVQAGGVIAHFMPMRPLARRSRSNLRLHRKIAVADGKDAIVGGMNVAHEYLGPNADAARWRDVSVRVRGPAAHALDEIFITDWAFAAHKTLPSLSLPAAAGDAEIQVVASGPDIAGDTFYDAILTALFAAKERVWMATPYFIPNEPLREGLELAVRRGVDVEVIVPNSSNHRVADLAGAASLRQLADTGVKVMRFGPEMLHAKVTIIDDLAVVGSANMDTRSLFLNYEVAAFLYSPAQVELLMEWYRALLTVSSPGVAPARGMRTVGEDLARLLAPLV